MPLNVSMWVSAAVHALITHTEDVCFCLPAEQGMCTSIHDTYAAQVQYLAVQTRNDPHNNFTCRGSNDAAVQLRSSEQKNVLAFSWCGCRFSKHIKLFMVHGSEL